MPSPNLSDYIDRLDKTRDAYLGEEITYQSSGALADCLKATVDYGDEPQDFNSGHVVDRQIMLKITKSLLPAKPSEADRITNLKRAPGLTFRPSGEPSSTSSGTRWLFYLKEVR